MTLLRPQPAPWILALTLAPRVAALARPHSPSAYAPRSFGPAPRVADLARGPTTWRRTALFDIGGVLLRHTRPATRSPGIPSPTARMDAGLSSFRARSRGNRMATVRRDSPFTG